MTKVESLKKSVESAQKKTVLERIPELAAEEFNKKEIYEAIFGLKDEILRQRVLNDARERAKKVKQTRAFDSNVKAYNNYIKKKSEKVTKMRDAEAYKTDFKDLSIQLNCGSFIANDDGVIVKTDKGDVVVCTHPIWLSSILKNAETGEYKVKITYRVRNRLQTMTVDKKTISSKTKILDLASSGIRVTDTNAQWLVKYLATLEAENENLITEKLSTSKLGWIFNPTTEKCDFLPYDSDIEIDSEQSIKPLFDSIKCVGNRDKYIEFVKNIRAKKNTPLLINMAATLASVLIAPCGDLPFIVSLWGTTGIGKTVILQLCASLFANPAYGAYISDAKSTAVANEVRLAAHNSLPFLIDDLAQIKNQNDGDFSSLIYSWCSGHGKGRSDKQLSIKRTPTWLNCTITNGERSLVDESTQGGAINRVIDIQAGNKPIFNADEGNKTHNFVMRNYGFVGKEFVRYIQSKEFDELISLREKYAADIRSVAKAMNCEKEEKQIIPMALILLADEIAEREIFKDGIRLNAIECVAMLKNRGEVNEHKRAYERLQDEITINVKHFCQGKGLVADNENLEYWGFREDGYCYFVPGKLDNLLKKNGFQSRSFKAWARDEGLMLTDKGAYDKTVRIGDLRRKFVVVRENCIDSSEDDISSPAANVTDSFTSVTDEEIPFQ